MLDKNQLVTIKGTRDGITVFIDDTCLFSDAIKELEKKMDKGKPLVEEPIVPVTVQLGNRYINNEQTARLKDILKNSGFIVDSFESNVINKETAEKWFDESQIKPVSKIVRSGQVLEVTGDLLLIGDVNPGGKVASTGNIFIMGSLYGIAHAGTEGDRKAIIAASYMKPSQLRIADYISRSPDYESTGVYMECGLIDEVEDKIIIDRLQVLTRTRKFLSGFERGIKNG